MGARHAPSGQRHPLPRRQLDIVSIGAGDIVRVAHLPAYRRAGYRIRGVFDRRSAAARTIARAAGGAVVHASLEAAFAERDVVFDVAVPPGEVLGIVERAPRGAAVLVQKPLGRDLREARAIVAAARRRRLHLAVHFQLRFAPAILELRRRLARGELGALREIEMRVVTHTHFERWSFLAAAPRLEVLYHSVHYLDLLRGLCGEPLTVAAHLSRDPAFPGLADTRSAIELTFRDGVRGAIRTDHASALEPAARLSELRVEGDRGAARLRLGVNLDYAAPPPDAFTLTRRARGRSVPLSGSWFPDAFAGPMSNLQRYVRGEDAELHTRASDALRTMELVELCYRSSARGRTLRFA